MANRYEQMEDPQPSSDATPLPTGTMPGTVVVHPSNNRYAQMEEGEKVSHSKAGSSKEEHVKSLWDVPGEAWHHASHSLREFYNAVRNTWQHPQDTYNALMKAPGGVPDLNAVVPGARDAMVNAAGGVALGALDPQAQAALLEAHPGLQPAADTGSAMSKYGHDAYGSPQAVLDSMGHHPFRTAADLSTVLTAPVMGAGLVGLGAKGLGLAAARLGSTTLGDAAATGLRGAEAVSSAMVLPAKIGDALNPINFVPDAPGNLIIGAGHAASGLGAERIGNMLKYGGKAIKPTEMLNNTLETYSRMAMAPENRVFLDAAGKAAPDVVTNLEDAAVMPGHAAGELVPGSKGTGPEHLVNVINAPRLQALSEGAKKNQVEMTNAMNKQNEAARVRHIELNAQGNVPLRDAAVAKRNADKARDYPISDATIAKGDASLVPIIQRPELANAIRQVKENYANSGVHLDLEYIPAHTVPTGVLDAKGNPIMRTVPAKYPDISGDVADAIKKQLDTNAFELTKTRGATDPNAKHIQDARDAFLGWVGHPSRNPAYPISRDNFAANSRIVDQRNTSLFMREHANNPEALKAAQDNVGNAQTRNPTVKAATGSSKYYSHLSDYMEPEQLSTFGDVIADHARSAESRAQSGLASEYRSDIDNAFDPVHSPHVAGLKGKIAAALFNQAIKDINPEVAASLSKALMTPEGTLELAQNALAQQTKIGKRTGAAKSVGNAFKNAFIRNPTMYNVMDDRRNAMVDMMNKRLGTDQ